LSERAGLGIDLDDTAHIPAARAMEPFNREGLTEIHLSYAEGAAAALVGSAALDGVTVAEATGDANAQAS
jgi:hypothetical protein